MNAPKKPVPRLPAQARHVLRCSSNGCPRASPVLASPNTDCEGEREGTLPKGFHRVRPVSRSGFGTRCLKRFPPERVSGERKSLVGELGEFSVGHQGYHDGLDGVHTVFRFVKDHIGI